MTIDPKAWALADHYLAPIRASTAGHVRELSRRLETCAKNYLAELEAQFAEPDQRLAARKRAGHQ